MGIQIFLEFENQLSKVEIESLIDEVHFEDQK